MSLSHAGPLNNAQRSSRNKPLPRLLVPPHLSPLSGAWPTQATRTGKKGKKKEYGNTLLPNLIPVLCGGKPLIEATCRAYACVWDIFPLLVPVRPSVRPPT